MNKFLIGLILGVAIAGGVAFYLNNMPTEFTSKVNSSTSSLVNSSEPIILAPGTKLKEVDKSNEGSKSNTSSPSYDFYDILQGKKVADEKADNSQKDSGKSTTYFIQAGVFVESSLAEDVKAKLALLGFDATIKSYSVAGKLINKVMLGPFNDEYEAKKIIHRLNDEDIQATIVQFKN